MIHLMLKYIPYRISLNKVIIILNQANVRCLFTNNVMNSLYFMCQQSLKTLIVCNKSWMVQG